MHDKSTDFQQKYTLNARGTLLDLSVAKVMGILNITPDSFYDGGRYTQVDGALRQTATMLAEGAAIIDVGAYSSRPGAADVSPAEERSRLVPVVEALVKEFPGIVISVDTFRSEIAIAAVEAGAALINDISGGDADEHMFAAAANLQVPYILMHMRGTPQTMTKQTHYDDLFVDVARYFAEKVARLTALGVHDVVLDPGFGFAKTRGQSMELLARIDELITLFRLPVLAGVSRKSMIYKFLETSPEAALNGTTVLHTIALLKGASLLRAHDVKAAAEAIKLVGALPLN